MHKACGHEFHPKRKKKKVEYKGVTTKDRLIIKGGTNNYTILDKAFFASKKLWYE